MKKINLIIVPFHDYKKWTNEGFRTRDAHLFEHFKNHKSIEKILVVNRPVSIAEMLLKRMSWKTNVGNVVYEEKSWRVVEVEKNIYYIDILLNDFFRVAIEGKKWWNTAFKNEKVIDCINKASDIIEINNKYLFLQNPMSIGIIGKLNEDVLAFDAIDNWLHHPQMKKNKKLIEENYKLIEENADVIFTVSESLKELFEKNDNVNWIPNAVDKEYFSAGINNEISNRKPIIGYVGKIQERVDFDLVEECLKKYSEYKFIFLGPILSEKNRIEEIMAKYKNIKFTGDIHYNLLPKEMKKIDIAIIPHKVNEFTNSMNPLKLYEYLAAGKQVVTTQVAGIENISQYVYESNTNDEFLGNIEKAIEIFFKEKKLGTKVADDLEYEYTWENRCRLMIKELIKD